MARAARANTAQDEQEDVAAVVPEQRSQVVPVGSMDTDPATGAEVRVGVPESDDEEAVGEFILWLQEEAEQENADSMAILAAQLRQANTATSLVEALREKKTINGKDYVGKPFMAHSFSIHEGKFEDEQIPYFASIEATDPDHPGGFVVNCGGAKVLMHMRTLQRFEAFPIPMRITGRETRKKRLVLSIEILEQTKH